MAAFAAELEKIRNNSALHNAKTIENLFLRVKDLDFNFTDEEIIAILRLIHTLFEHKQRLALNILSQYLLDIPETLEQLKQLSSLNSIVVVEKVDKSDTDTDSEVYLDIKKNEGVTKRVKDILIPMARYAEETKSSYLETIKSVYRSNPSLIGRRRKHSFWGEEQAELLPSSKKLNHTEFIPIKPRKLF